MNISFSISLPRDKASVPIVRHLCGDALRALGVEEACVFDVEVAVTEASTNVLKHAVARREHYEVDVEIKDGACEIRVVDIGNTQESFEHENRGLTEASLTSEEGRGIHLMRMLVDKLEFVAAPEAGAIVHLVKTLDLREDSILHARDAGIARV